MSLIVMKIMSKNPKWPYKGSILFKEKLLLFLPFNFQMIYDLLYCRHGF